MFQTLTSRLYTIFGVIFATVLLGIGGYAFVAKTSAAEMRADYQRDVEGSVQLAKAQNAIWALRWGFAQYIALGDSNPEGRAKVLADDPKHFDTVTEALAAMLRLDLEDNEKQGAKELQTAFKAYYDARAPWFALMKEGKVAEAAELRAKTTTPFGAATVKALAGQFDLHKANALASLKAAEVAEGRMQAALAAVALLLLLPVPAVWWLGRSIVRPVEQAIRNLEAVADGDLSRDIPQDLRGEMGRMLGALGRMQDRMRLMIGNIRQTADSIQVASSEVASGNIDLSQRTEQTAGRLQQTASSMEELTVTVKQTADSAGTANQLASSASAVAQRGGAVVAQVITTMDEITTSSKRIADIIGTIDGIAFQTNILALNAAVEAARAGEQGRGFAVVASEVRSLAQRSAEAAREIKSLIGKSVESVESGSRLVADAGTTMTEIVASVQRVTDIIGEISAAASEQSAGIGNVNVAVSELDQMTQQNAALVEQSAAAAQSLADQSRKLAGVVATFRLAQGSPALAPAAQPVQAAGPKAVAGRVLASASHHAGTKTRLKTAAGSKPSALQPATRAAHAAPAAKVTPAAAAAPSAARAAPAAGPTATANSSDWETF